MMNVPLALVQCGNMTLLIELINGIKVGIEYIEGGDEGDDYSHAVIVDLFFFRLGFFKFYEE